MNKGKTDSTTGHSFVPIVGPFLRVICPHFRDLEIWRDLRKDYDRNSILSHLVWHCGYVHPKIREQVGEEKIFWLWKNIFQLLEEEIKRVFAEQDIENPKIQQMQECCEQYILRGNNTKNPMLLEICISNIALVLGKFIPLPPPEMKEVREIEEEIMTATR